METINQWLKKAENQLLDVTEFPKSEAEIMVLEVLNEDRLFLVLNRNQDLSGEEGARLDAMLSQRLSHKPLQYILGHVPFMSLDLLVNEKVLIPRQDTELLVEWVLEYAKDMQGPIRILDMCTGSGAVGISLMVHLSILGKTPQVDLIDIDRAAIKLAKKNIEHCLDDALKQEIRCLESNLFESDHLRSSYDIIVSNPPYIPLEEMKALDISVANFEPELALYGGEDGLDFYRKITRDSKRYLPKGGILFYEIGHNQGPEVAKIMIQNGFEHVVYKKDFSHLDRNVMGVHI